MAVVVKRLFPVVSAATGHSHWYLNWYTYLIEVVIIDISEASTGTGNVVKIVADRMLQVFCHLLKQLPFKNQNQITFPQNSPQNASTCLSFLVVLGGSFTSIAFKIQHSRFISPKNGKIAASCHLRALAKTLRVALILGETLCLRNWVTLRYASWKDST